MKDIEWESELEVHESRQGLPPAGISNIETQPIPAQKNINYYATIALKKIETHCKI